MEQDFYEVLGVPRDAKPEEIKAAYRALALRRHPDLNAGDPRAAGVFMRLQAAYETLENPYLRARYDLARSVKGREAGPIAVTVAGDVAWAMSTSRTRGTYGDRAIDSVGAELMVLVRTPQGWKIAAVHWSSRRRG